MADKSLGRNYFPILRLKQEIEGGKEVKPLGYFSCRESTTRFLALGAKIAGSNALITFTRKAISNRSHTLADGTILDKSTADAGGGAEASKGIKSLSRGNKPIKLITGKKIADSNNNNAKHSVSFRFPGWCTVQIISNALGLTLNNETVSATPDSAQIYPFFITPGGKRYPIATNTGAEAAEVVAIATSPTGLEALVSQAGGGVQVEPAQPSKAP